MREGARWEAGTREGEGAVEAGGGSEMRVVVAVVVTARSGSALPALVRGKSHSTLLPHLHTPGHRVCGD